MTCLLQPPYQVSKQHNRLGHILRAKAHTELAVNFPLQQLVILNRSLFLRHWHVWAQKLQTEQSAFQTKTPNDKRHRGAERAWLGALSLCLLVFGSSRQSAAKCCSLSEHFSPGGLPCSHLQGRVAGDESRAPRNQPSIPDTRAQFSPSYPQHLLSCGIKRRTWKLCSYKVTESLTIFLPHGDHETGQRICLKNCDESSSSCISTTWRLSCSNVVLLPESGVKKFYFILLQLSINL